MRDYGRRPKRYDSAIGEVIAGGFLTIGGGVYDLPTPSKEAFTASSPLLPVGWKPS